MDAEAIRLIQLSDMHLMADNSSLLGVNTTASLYAVVDLIGKEETPQLFLLTGDLSNDESNVSYQKIAGCLQNINAPIYVVPGNHDDPQLMSEIYADAGIKLTKHIVLANWQIILLNSHQPNQKEGFLDASQISHLQACLEANPDHHTIIGLHHQPVPIGSSWMDRIGLQNPEAFWRVLANYSNIKAIVFGHVHQEHSGIMLDIPYFGVPSTSYQFLPNSDEFQLENIPPGYRWIDLYANGKLATGVKRLNHYVGDFDKT